MDLTPSAQQALVNRAAELERLGFEVEPFGGATIKVTAVPALLKIEDSAKALLRARRGSRGARSRRAGAGRAAAHRRDDRVPRGGEGELSADATRR